MMKTYEVNPIICSPENNKRYLKFYRNYWVHIDTLLNVFIPSIIMFISSLIICSTIRRSIIKFRRRSRLVSVFCENTLNVDVTGTISKTKSFKQKTNKNLEVNSLSFVSPTVSLNSSIKIPKIRKIAFTSPLINHTKPSIKRFSSVPNNINVKYYQSACLEPGEIKKTKMNNFLKRCFNFKIFLQKRKTKPPLRKPDKIYILIILVAINVLFIALTAPIVLYLSQQTRQIHEIENQELRISYRFIKTVCVCLMNANHAINILIYGN